MEVPAAGPDSIRPARKPLRGHPRVKGEPRPRTASPCKLGPSHNPPVKAKPARIRAAIRWPEPRRLEMSHPGGRGTPVLPVIRLPGATAADSSDAAGLISHAAVGVTCSVFTTASGLGSVWARTSMVMALPWGHLDRPSGVCTVCIFQPVAQTPARAPEPEDLGLSSGKYPIYGGRVGLRAFCATG
jgi:hypothetical protein